MADWLVRLYDLPDPAARFAAVEEAGYHLVRPVMPSRSVVVRWVRERFSEGWVSEVEAAFGSQPVTCIIALDSWGKIAGFACYDVTFRGFFGPMAVDEEHRGVGLGTALLFRALGAMRENGYAYAVIGDAADGDFYANRAGAIEIPDSEPGPYRDRPA